MAEAVDTISSNIPQNITQLALALSVCEIAIANLTHSIRVATPDEGAALIDLLDAAEEKRERLVEKILAAEARCPSEALEKMRAFVCWQRHCAP
jgi:hypothetical protein